MANTKKDIPSWYRLRRYVHFDEPLSIKKAEALVTDPNAVVRHSFWPLVRFGIETVKIRQEKGSGTISTKKKLREISYAAHSDSQIFSYYCQLLSAIYEEKIAERGLGDSVLAFRSCGKNNIHFAKQAFDTIRAMGECTAIAFDVRKFFDTLSHRLLKMRWKELLGGAELPPDHYAVFKAVTKFSIVDRDKAFAALDVSVHNPRCGGRRRLCTPSEYRDLIRGANLIETNSTGIGIPQGTAISALLSNLYMLEFDSAALKFVHCYGGTYMRYCDDMLFLMPLGMKEEAEAFVQKEIEKLKVEINIEKTDACDFMFKNGEQMSDRPLQYLGFMYDGQRVVIRSAAFAKFSNRMKRGVSLAKQTMRSKNKLRKRFGVPERKLYLKKLLTRYSHLGKRNFLRYGHNAANLMGSSAIRKQLRPLWSRLCREIKR
ncbi:MAG: hypothetical protein JSR69_16055 [Proteobacteria bacterium]|nr:hypothetical protein [Pseudomonadota bacterium]